jgi:hypothetical protein
MMVKSSRSAGGMPGCSTKRRAVLGNGLSTGRKRGASSVNGADVPLEFKGKVARTRAMAEAGDIEGGATAARHDSWVAVAEARIAMRAGGSVSERGCWRWGKRGSRVWVVV